MHEKQPEDHHRRLLIVEDEEAQRHTLKSILEKEGFDVTCAANAAQALEQMQQRNFGVAVVDLRLPDLPGTRLLDEIQRLNGKTRVIINTAFGGFDSAKDAVNLGAFAYVEKAGDPEELIRYVHAASRWHLERYARDLESAVEERTRELHKANEGLKKQMAEREMAEAALMESEERHRAFLQNFQGIAYQADIFSFEPSMMHGLVEPISGYSAEDFLSGKVSWGELIHPEDAAMIREELLKLNDQPGYVADAEYRIRHMTGEVRWIRDIGRVQRDESGKPLFVQGAVYDITDQKRSEERARRQQRQLLQADKMVSLGILVSGVAHEINNPNHFIMSHTGPLLKAWKQAEPILSRYDEEVGGFALAGMPFSEARGKIPGMYSAILDGSKRISAIVDELRDYAREHPEEQRETIQINHVLKSALTLLANMVKHSTERFEVIYGRKLPPVMGSYQRLEQVVINLVQNACQSLPDRKSGIRITTKHDRDTGSVVLEVKDEGVGIAEENMDRIMDPFFTTKRNAGGSGLGLSISSSIAMEHGGTLTLTSTEGAGTTATMSLPEGKRDVIVEEE